MTMPEPVPPMLERDSRQRSLVPPERLASCHALVVGVGAIGRQVALQLAAVGVPQLTLFDDDRVGAENLGPQGYFADDVSTPKVAATLAVCRRLNPALEAHAVAERFQRSSAGMVVGDRLLVAFACVDRIATRRLLWESLRHRAAFYADGRMSAEVLRVLAVDAPATNAVYATTLFAPAEAFAGPCTARSTIYTASIAAGLMLCQWTRWLRGLAVDPDLTVNLLASEWTLAGGTSR